MQTFNYRTRGNDFAFSIVQCFVTIVVCLSVSFVRNIHLSFFRLSIFLLRCFVPRNVHRIMLRHAIENMNLYFELFVFLLWTFSWQSLNKDSKVPLSILDWRVQTTNLINCSIFTRNSQREKILMIRLILAKIFSEKFIALIEFQSQKEWSRKVWLAGCVSFKILH